ncbi:MAG: ATP-binding protein [Verrucomicrobia bacterium]|nr:ATP-binding protein [Verrucomicrobiota bacterium]
MISEADKACISQEIIEKLTHNLNHPPQERPLLILLGGFQGSGKSTVAQALEKAHQYTVISTDAIRHELLQKNITGDLFAKMVSSISKIILMKVLDQRLNLIVDANAHEKRIREVTDLMQHYPSYRVVKIYLQTSEKVLFERLASRPQVPGHYQGQPGDLQGSLQSSKMNTADYDLVLQTDNLTIEQELTSINSLLASYYTVS